MTLRAPAPGPASTPAAPAPRVPPLEPGDHLTRDEFERRYDATPGLRKAELIEGVVHMPPPVRWVQHGDQHGALTTWLGVYRWNTPGVRMAPDITSRLDLDNEPQPDVALMIHPDYGGQARFSADGYLEGAPELVAEVAASTASIDLNSKLRAYRRNGVTEYLVWRVLDGAIDWFTLRQGRYDPIAAGPDGLHRSDVFPGLWLDAAAMLRDDMPAVSAALQRGLATPEHAAFVARLKSQKKP